MVLGDALKRVCIYFIYDRDGIIDDYILYQLNDLRKNVAFLHCVINGKLTQEGRTRLEPVADEIYVRENEGNDIGAYKAAVKYIGWKKLRTFDELVLMNNTCFGPIYPFQEAFDWAKVQDVDFWALTVDTKSDWMGHNAYPHYNKKKTHYQSYFLVIRQPLLTSRLFSDFFEEIPENTNYIESGCLYEYAFPGYFEEKGYRGAAYCECVDLNYPLLHDPVSLFKEYRMPLFKKRSFFHHYTDVLNNTAGEGTAKLLRFLAEETDYDIDMIWQTLLRTASLSDLVRCAHLNRVLPRNMLTAGSGRHSLKIGIVYHSYYEDLVDETVSYIQNFPSGTGVLVTTDTEEKKTLLEKRLEEAGLKATVRKIENRGRDISSLLVGAAGFVFDYDLVCFAHDKKSSQVWPHSVGRAWAYKLDENVFATKEYVANVIHLFEEESRLGIAFPSPPNHSGYAYNIRDGWSGNYINTRKLLDDLCIDVKMNEHTLCVAPLGTCFWFRPNALKRLFSGYRGKGWSFKDFPREPNRSDQTLLHAIERAYAYVAQDAGYYPAYLYNDKYAQIEFTNLEFVKAGSTEMRAWVEALAMDAIGYKKLEDVFQKPAGEITSQDVVPYYDPNWNFGIKESLRHLALALRHKFPRFWALMLPIRRLGQKILGIKTVRC